MEKTLQTPKKGTTPLFVKSCTYRVRAFSRTLCCRLPLSSCSYNTIDVCFSLMSIISTCPLLNPVYKLCPFYLITSSLMTIRRQSCSSLGGLFSQISDDVILQDQLLLLEDWFSPLVNIFLDPLCMHLPMYICNSLNCQFT